MISVKWVSGDDKLPFRISMEQERRVVSLGCALWKLTSSRAAFLHEAVAEMTCCMF